MKQETPKKSEERSEQEKLQKLADAVTAIIGTNEFVLMTSKFTLRGREPRNRFTEIGWLQSTLWWHEERILADMFPDESKQAAKGAR